MRLDRFSMSTSRPVDPHRSAVNRENIRKRWGEPRHADLRDLPPEVRRTILLLIESSRRAQAERESAA